MRARPAPMARRTANSRSRAVGAGEQQIGQVGAGKKKHRSGERDQEP